MSDNGPGIPADQLEHIFERFTRGDAGLTQRVGGTGLGLAISKSLVELHGGTIAAESAPGDGSTFRVRLPARPAPADGGPSRAARRRADGAVLVADDSETILLLMRTRLEMEGYEVDDRRRRPGGDRRDAAATPSRLPDLLLLDAMMPRKSGIDALRELRAAGRRDPGPDRQRPPGRDGRRRRHRPRGQRLRHQADRLRPAARQHRRADRARPDRASALGDLEPDLFAFELGAVEELDGPLGLIGVDLDEGEAVQDADVVDRLLGQDGALAQRPAQVLLGRCRCARRG